MYSRYDRSTRSPCVHNTSLWLSLLHSQNVKTLNDMKRPVCSPGRSAQPAELCTLSHTESHRETHWRLIVHHLISHRCLTDCISDRFSHQRGCCGSTGHADHALYTSVVSLWRRKTPDVTWITVCAWRQPRLDTLCFWVVCLSQRVRVHPWTRNLRLHGIFSNFAHRLDFSGQRSSKHVYCHHSGIHLLIMTTYLKLCEGRGVPQGDCESMVFVSSLTDREAEISRLEQMFSYLH